MSYYSLRSLFFFSQRKIPRLVLTRDFCSTTFPSRAHWCELKTHTTFVSMATTQTKEFTLPFVGREEELQFLLGEYDQMLHAQYRSVWIEAPAGMGKTTLVEEFLKRIISFSTPASVGAQQMNVSVSSHSSAAPLQRQLIQPLRPWIIHAHLRERSSNSLASFVEALGATLQTLTEQQREKLFSKLTSFYQEHARRIVGGGNVQSMDMEEAITTAGYILKRLSFYFPLVVIIEDIHVLKGEMSFYALRHLQAIVEHIPMMFLFVSRPSEEKELKEFCKQTLNEGAKKLSLEELKRKDIKQLLGEGFKNESIEKLTKLSGGNALLLRELLRASIQNPEAITEKGERTKFVSDSSSENIIYYLTEELRRLPKKDRHVATIAGVLGQEFSEELVESIASSKHFHCWSVGVLERLEHHGIIRRERKQLQSDGAAQEKISFRVSIFRHALWWEAARELYQWEKKQAKWSDKKLAEVIVPILTKQEYPLVTDAELIVNLFRWIPIGDSVKLLRYVYRICGLHSLWNFHSYEQLITIYKKVYECVNNICQRKNLTIDKETMLILINILSSARFVFNKTIKERGKTYFLDDKLLRGFLKYDEVQKIAILSVFDRGVCNFPFSCDEKGLEESYKSLQKLKLQITRQTGDRNSSGLISAVYDIIKGHRLVFTNATLASKYYYSAAGKASGAGGEEINIVALALTYIGELNLPPALLQKYYGSIETFRKQLNNENKNRFTIRQAYHAEINIAYRMSDTCRIVLLRDEYEKLTQTISMPRERYIVLRYLFKIHSYMGNWQAARLLAMELFSNTFTYSSSINRYRWVCRQLFFLEEVDRLEELWQKNKMNLFDFNTPETIGLLEDRALLSLLAGLFSEADTAIELLNVSKKKFPLFTTLVKKSLRIINTFYYLNSRGCCIQKIILTIFYRQKKL